MNIWFNAIARAGGIEVAPKQRIFPPSQPKAPRNRTTRRLARRVLADVGGSVSRLIEGFRTARRRGAAIRELSTLSDHALKDIGLHRGEIRSVVDEMTRAAAPARRQAPVSRRPALADTFLGARPCAQPC